MKILYFRFITQFGPGVFVAKGNKGFFRPQTLKISAASTMPCNKLCCLVSEEIDNFCVQYDAVMDKDRCYMYACGLFHAYGLCTLQLVMSYDYYIFVSNFGL